MPFEIKGTEKLEARVNLRMTKKELERLKEDATVANLTISELVRRRYFGRPIMASVDATTVRELRRLGGLIKKVHVDSGGAYREQTAELLSQLNAAVIALSEVALAQTKRGA